MKKNFSLFFVFIFAAFILKAQQRAVTSNGDEVILNADGTWKYANDSVAKSNASRIDTSKTKFSKGSTATFLVKSNKTDLGVYIDPKKWSFEKKNPGEAAEYEFKCKDKDIYSMLISEKIEMPLATLKDAALHNAMEAAPDIKLIKEEYRYVNNNLVLFMQMNGTVSGMKITYFGYYFSSPKGTTQFLVYTSTALLEEYQKELENFINGLVKI